MFRARFYQFFIQLPLSVAFLTFLPACGSGSSLNDLIALSSTNCPSGSAAIEVGDSYLRILCGCTGRGESDGTLFGTPGGLTCTLPSGGSLVVFHSLTATLNHQIVSTGTSSFVASPVFDPRATPPVRTHAVMLNTPTTTFQFQDIYTGMTGQIRVP